MDILLIRGSWKECEFRLYSSVFLLHNHNLCICCIIHKVKLLDEDVCLDIIYVK